MGFFSNQSQGASFSGRLEPLSKQRVKEALERAGWVYEVDDDDIIAGWDYGHFIFFLNGKREELFCVRGYWRGQLPESEYQGALELANEWNRDKIWPKIYVAMREDTKVIFSAEVNVAYEYGLTDEQLDLHLQCAINTAMGFFEHLNETYPEIWGQFDPQTNS